MVEDLARWKVTLSQKLNEATATIDTILKEHKFLFEHMCTTYKLVKFVINYV